MPVEHVEVLRLHDLGDEQVPHGQEHQDDHGEDHLDVGPGGEAEDAENQKLANLGGKRVMKNWVFKAWLLSILPGRR